MRRVCALVPLGDPAIADPFAAVAAAAAVAARGGGQASAILLAREARRGDAALAQAAREGAAEILRAAHPALPEAPQAEHLLAAFAHLLRTEARDGLFILPAGPVGEELAARLALRLDAVPLGRCTDIAWEGRTLLARRPAYGGRAEARLATEATLCLAAMRRPAAAAAPAGGAPAVRAVTLDVALPGDLEPPGVAEPAADAPRRPEGARIVVAGGRGMGGAEGFAQLRELAALLDGAVGASLPAVDAGWAAVAQQVGQSGAFVAPELYLAFGLSGTAQHLAGIGPGTRIVAVNPDPEAEIFRVAELGLVAPWQEVLPRLIGRLRRA
ncbi:electron transfer flavoprotein subunit alpha [Caldovatus sediminis]|uniref:Electron transfer flavoprotein subunit alpha n=1 Tax=Caldovatus sediminis TaxID=2041189 RepID=A0A8J2ZEU6_9PROT|nr:electron transfer flavoprotein subunit alpha/FixB family protein [Caldovatus sediminis]GGG46063.1 electron transfer flavoprotein subunit alpha [Caldovatus sediminis]